MTSFSKGASCVKHFFLWKLSWWNENDVILPHSPNSTDSWLIDDDLRKPLGNNAFDMPTINQHRTLIWTDVRPTKNNFVEPYRIVHIWTANVRPTIGPLLTNGMARWPFHTVCQRETHIYRHWFCATGVIEECFSSRNYIMCFLLKIVIFVASKAFNF